MLWHLVLPVVVLVLGSLPVLLRHVRAALLETIDSPFIRAALGYGISRHRVLFRHALPAAVNPLVSLFAFSLAALLSGSLLTEVIMSWPGLGPLLLEAVLARDIYVVVGAVTFSTFFLVAGMALRDSAAVCGRPAHPSGDADMELPQSVDATADLARGDPSRGALGRILLALRPRHPEPGSPRLSPGSNPLGETGWPGPLASVYISLCGANKPLSSAPRTRGPPTYSIPRPRGAKQCRRAP